LNTDPRGCIASLLVSQPVRCDFLAGNRGGTVVLVGDSHAGQWFTPIRAYAADRGLSLATFIKSSCAVADVPVFSIRLRRESHECRAWREQVTREIAQMKPEMVIVSQFTTSYARTDADDDGKSVSKTEWVHGVERSLRLLARSGTKVVLLADTPRMGFHVPFCLTRPSRGVRDVCSSVQAIALDEELMSAESNAARRAGATYIDMTKLFCWEGKCPPMNGSSILYKDGNHIAEGYARALYPDLARRLDAR
jgi:hypothetical protein